MEKSRTITSIFCTRLLIVCQLLFLLCSQALFAQRLNTRLLKTLRITPLSESGFADKESGFVLSIPGVMPEDIQISPPSLPLGVSFVSSKQSVFSTGTETVMGTQITFWFNFSEPGTYTLPELQVNIKNKPYTFPFDPIKITEDPTTITPRIYIHFTHGIYDDETGEDVIREFSNKISMNGAHVVLGTPVKFVIYIQYAVQIIKFEWKLQKGSLCTQTKEYEITKGHNRGAVFSEQKIPVAEFEWQPLSEGEWTLPPVLITASAYNGSRIDLTLPLSTIKVRKGSESSFIEQTQSRKEDTLFSSAFVAERNSVITVDAKSEFDCSKLAALRNQERHSLPFSALREDRRVLERNAGIISSIDEPSVLLRTILMCVFVFTLGICCVSIYCKKIRLTAISFLLSICFFSGIVYIQLQLRHTYGIFAGGTLYSIPEESATESSDFSAITSGSRVEILEQPGGWMYIQFNGTGGWVKSDQIYIIR